VKGTQKAELYRIIDQGVESEYFNMIMENVKITSISPLLHPTGLTTRISKIFNSGTRRLHGSIAMGTFSTLTNGITELRIRVSKMKVLLILAALLFLVKYISSPNVRLRGQVLSG
jgi:hypothetical protein